MSAASGPCGIFASGLHCEGMRWGPLAAVLLSVAARAQGPGAASVFDDSGVRVYYNAQNLWRAKDGAFVGRREATKLVLVYDFFDSDGEEGRYAACPSNRGDPARAPSCGAIQAAVGEALGMWSEAAGVLSLRRRTGSEPVNIWIAWTDGFRGRFPPIARSVDNSRDADEPTRTDADQGFHGLNRVGYPGDRKTSGALLFNDSFCWYLDEAVCPAPVRLANGKTVSNNHSVRTVSLHEAGHVLGFGHFTVPSIMGLSGGTGRYELTPYDREAVRRLYELVNASVPSW